MKKKICHITSAHPRYDIRIFEKECVSLARVGYEVYLVVNDDKEDEVKNGVHILSTAYTPHNRIDRMFHSTHKIYIKALSTNADVFHFHDPELMFVAGQLKQQGKKVIFDAHESVVAQIQEKDWIPLLLRKPIALCYEKIQNYVCKKVDAIITVTPNLVKYFQSINSNTIMVTNYPLIDEIKYVRQPLKQVCFAGLLNSTWCHEDIICAINQIEGVQYVIAGNIQENYLKILKEHANDNLIFKGKVSHEEVADIYSKSMVGIALNNSKQMKEAKGSLGNTKIFEYMMHGLPVICSDYERWKEIIEDNQCGICVENNNIEQIRDAIIYVMNNYEDAKKMGENGKKIVKEFYNWNNEFIKLEDLYLKLME